jgi:excisionase family DNA binding protein
VLSAKQLADLLGITRKSVWNLLAAGRLPEPIRLSRATVRWRREAIEEFLRQHEPRST